MELPTTRRLIGWTKRLLPVLIGATGGFAYYYFIGCVSGTCPITSNPWTSTGYGMLLGIIATWGTGRPRDEQRKDKGAT
jgi:hypothetical protein